MIGLCTLHCRLVCRELIALELNFKMQNAQQVLLQKKKAQKQKTKYTDLSSKQLAHTS
jgi:hypothetical protein